MGEIEMGRHRLIDDRIEYGTQIQAVGGIAFHPRRNIRMRLDIGRDLSLPGIVEYAIDKSLQIVLGDRSHTHFTLRRCAPDVCAAPAAPSHTKQSRSRALDSLDITVPIGMASTSATSA